MFSQKGDGNRKFSRGFGRGSNNTIIGRGSEGVKSSNDVTKHAEIEAIKDALNTMGPNNLELCDLYTTHGPCFKCSYVIRHYKIRTLFYVAKVDHVGGIISDLKVMLTSKVPSWGKAPIIIDNVLGEKCKRLSKHYKV